GDGGRYGPPTDPQNHRPASVGTIQVDADSPDGNSQGERQDATAGHPDMERQTHPGSPADASGTILRTEVQQPISRLPSRSGLSHGAPRGSGSVERDGLVHRG